MAKSESAIRADMRKEYLRGLKEAEKTHIKGSHAFLAIIRDSIVNIMNNCDDMDEAELQLQRILQLIDDYTDGEITAKDIRALDFDDNDVTIEDKIDEVGKRDIISLTDFVRKDF